MKKLIQKILVSSIAFSAVTIPLSSLEKTQIAQAKTTKQLKADGKKKIKTYLYEYNPMFKKSKIAFDYFKKEKNGDLYYEVYEVLPTNISNVGPYKLTKKSGYKNLYRMDLVNVKWKLVKKFKK